MSEIVRKPIMAPIYKYIISFCTAGFILGYSITYFFAEGTRKSNIKVQKLAVEFAKKDTLVMIYKAGFEKLGKENISIAQERDLYKGKFDTSLTHIMDLSKPVVKKKDINEALQWVDQYNSSVE